MTTRREFLTRGLALGAAGLWLPQGRAEGLFDIPVPTLPAGDVEQSVMATLPGKRPLIKRTWRPANFETPVTLFDRSDFTPNDAFFVRWHLSGLPETNDPSLAETNYVLKIGGDAVENPLSLSLPQLKREFEQVELVAICLCSGNRRGLVQPHVAGIEWGYGAMGQARWRGVRLRDVLNRARLRKEALEVVYDGLDRPVLEKTPDFIKSLPVWKALDENTLLAWEMNGEPLPYHNGYPLRLVVPGWTATYWMKMISEINVVSKPYDGFWMKTAYRVPTGKFPVTDRFISQEVPGGPNTPITETVVNSLITNLEPNQKIRAGQWTEVRGIAWDGGRGIRLVEVSTDGGRCWQPAELGRDLGNFAWRSWSYRFKPRKGRYGILAKATNAAGSTQTFQWIANPAGYHHNVIQRIDVEAV
jgi:DMSO/TMAO reductase YedYZ molybdopterin-dependent catalytic subunit